MSASDPALVAAVQKAFDNLLCSACQRHGLNISIRDCLPHIGTHRADFAILVSAWLGTAREGLEEIAADKPPDEPTTPEPDSESGDWEEYGYRATQWYHGEVALRALAALPKGETP